jgi:hypothetical protein
MKKNCASSWLFYHHRHHHHHHVHEWLGVFPVPWSSKQNWSLHQFLGRPMFLCPFGLYCNACFGKVGYLQRLSGKFYFVLHRFSSPQPQLYTKLKLSYINFITKFHFTNTCIYSPSGAMFLLLEVYLRPRIKIWLIIK